jgi:endonuclease-3
MTRPNKAQFIKETLDQLFPVPSIPLHHRDPYTLLIAVLLSAQCTDLRVNQITPILFKKAANPKDMAQLRVSDIEEIIRPCGLAKRKSHAIWRLSQILEEKYDGEVPRTFKELEALPGVGHKTASVIMAQSFGIPTFPIDTHIHRLAKRWGLSAGRTVIETEKDLKQIFNKKDWIKLHLQMIYFARKYCPALNHKLNQCPICSQLKDEV